MRINNENVIKEFYDEYKRLKGKHDFETYKKNLDVFFDYTLDVYTGGEISENDSQSREEAISLWIKYIGKEREARRYFKSVDNIHSYS